MNRLLSKKWPPFLLLGLAALLVWGHTVTFDFVWDDTFFIRDLQSVRSVKNIPAMFTSIEAQATDPYLFRVFRPIRTAHYALLHTLDGHEIPQPWIFHLANVLWHGATAMMLFAVLCRLLPKFRADWNDGEARLWSLLIALGFAVHPVVSEVVCWAKGLDDILATFFTLACLRELLKPADERKARWLALFFFTLAVYSKESAVPFAVIPFFIYRSIHKLAWHDAAWRTVVFLLVATAYMAHRGYIIERNSQTAPLSGTYTQTLVDMLPIVPKYFRLLLGVPPFLADYKFMKGGFTPASPEVLSGLLLLLFLVVVARIAWRCNKFKAAGFGLFWTGLFLLPASNVLPMMQYMAERFLYLPLIGWLLAVVMWPVNIVRKRLAVIGALAVFSLWGTVAWNRSWVWQDELTLFVRTSQDGPHNERMVHNAVAAILHLPHVSPYFHFDEATDKLIVRGNVPVAEREKVLLTFEEAERLFPRNHIVTTLYAIALANSGQPCKAVLLFEKAARLRPQNGDYWLNLARARMECGQPEKARPALEAAAKIAPDNLMVLGSWYDFYWSTGDFAAARDVAIKLNGIEPTVTSAKMILDADEKLAAQKKK